MKIIIILLALSIGGTAMAQCRKHSDSPSSLTATFSGGLAQTLNAELTLRIKHTYNIGAGAGVMVNNTIREKDNIVHTRNDHAYYINLGYQKNKIFLGARIGNQTIVHVTTTSNHIPDKSKFLIGGLIGYSLTPRIRFNIGYDTFNATNVGVASGELLGFLVCDVNESLMSHRNTAVIGVHEEERRR